MSNHVIDLFCGAGGLSLGFSRIGLQPSFAADFNDDACATYSANLRAEAKTLDLGSVDRTTIHRLLLPFKNCFAVIGGPPCQGFSTAGARRFDDPRNHLVFRYLDIVEFLNPRWFLFENVEGILTSNGGESIHNLLSCFIAKGYTVRIEKVNFAAYGLPQSRKRVLLVGNRVGADFGLPPQTNSFSSGKHESVTSLPSSPSLLSAITDLPKCGISEGYLSYGLATPSPYGALMRNKDNTGVLHHYAGVSASDREKFGLLKPGQTMRDLPEKYWHPSFRRRAYRRVIDGTPTEKRGGPPSGVKRLFPEKACLTITSAACREFIHPIEDRPLTLREVARLQSFPDSWNFNGSHSAVATQIGNAVPPLAAEVLARHVSKLEGAFGSGRGNLSHVAPGLLGFRLTDSLGKSPALQCTEALLRSLPIVGRGKIENLYGTYRSRSSPNS